MSDASIMGVVCVNKHKGVTSHDMVNKLRKLYNTKQVGHTGSLDPIATGVLPVMIGRAVKASEYLTANDKAYVAEFKLGIVTDSGDITGKVVSRSSDIPRFEEVKKAVALFKGDIKQIPPMYSALKVNGKKLVDLARKGVTIERQARDIRIDEIEVDPKNEENGEYRLTVSCSKGAYIRTLCADIGEKLGCGATMTSLNRIKSGSFELSRSYAIEELENMSYEERVSLLVPVEKLFSDIGEIILPPFYERLARCGAEIYIKKLDISPDEIELNSRFRLYGENGFFALGEARDYPDGKAIKTIKLFELQ